VSAARLGLSLRDLVWFEQSAAVRIKAPAAKRLEVRTALERGRELLSRAREIEDARARGLLGAAALRAQIAAVADAAGFEDVARARAHLRDSLDDSRLRAALDAYTAPDSDLPAGDRSFDALVDLASFIDCSIDNRSPREVLLGRLLWRVAIAVVVVCAAWFALEPKNLARGATVTSSSACHTMPGPKYGKPPVSRLVDGVVDEATFGACTDVQVNPWITVDLGAEKTIRDVVVHSRSDCCWGSTDLPLELQLSTDDREFVTVATRTRPFTDQLPWKIKLNGQSARYVRLYNPSNVPRDIVLNEIVIHGR